MPESSALTEPLSHVERAVTLSLDALTAQADPGATISPAALEVARTFASRTPVASSFDVTDLPPVSLAADAASPSRGADIVIVRELGQGGMGRVDLARQTVFDRVVAVKRVRPDRLCERAVDALLAEARLSGALDHPNIVPVHLLGRSETGEPVLVMKRVEGSAWLDLVRADGPHGLRGDALGRHLETLRQVCNAVEFAHRQGIIHRDIKPENVMVGDLGEVYLLDWGVATRVGGPPSTEFAGTPAYMAPEMLPGAGVVTTRTDVYLLGATLHELLTGRPRHEGDSMWAVLGSALRSDPATFDDAVPAELAALVNRATARDPGERFASALAFSDAIADFQRHRGSLDLSLEAERLGRADLVAVRLVGQREARQRRDARAPRASAKHHVVARDGERVAGREHRCELAADAHQPIAVAPRGFAGRLVGATPRVVAGDDEMPELLVFLREEKRQRRGHPQGRRALRELDRAHVVADLAGLLRLRQKIAAERVGVGLRGGRGGRQVDGRPPHRRRPRGRPRRGAGGDSFGEFGQTRNPGARVTAGPAPTDPVDFGGPGRRSSGMATPRKAPAARPRRARAATVEIKVDRALKRSWDALTAAMHASKRQENGGFDAYWEAVGAIIDHDPPVYLAGGCATVTAFLAQHVGESERTARRMVRVARYASPDDETRFGVSRLDAALTLLEAQGMDLVRGHVPVDFGRLRVAVTRDGRSSRVPLVEASVDEVRGAARALQRKGRKVAASASPTTRAVTDALAKVAALRKVTVRHAHDALTLGGIPTAAWDAFAKAAAKVKLPTG